jgi:hypothetical protein
MHLIISPGGVCVGGGGGLPKNLSNLFLHEGKCVCEGKNESKEPLLRRCPAEKRQ